MEETPETTATAIPVASPEPPTAPSAVEDGAADAAPALAAAPEAPRNVAVTTRVAPSAPADTPPAPYDFWLPVVIIVGLAVVIVVIYLLLGRRGRKGATSSAKAGAKSVGDVVEIYVGNLSYDMTEDQFRKEFEKFGVVKSARIIGHRTSGKSKGYGFVTMPHRKEALVAIKALNNRDVMGRKLRVNEARDGMPRE